MNDYLPTEFNLGQNYPNPFKDKTSIKYCVAYKTRVNLTVYDSDGKEIEKLVDEEKKPGTYEVVFSICHSRESLPDGLYAEKGGKAGGNLTYKNYYYRIQAGDYSKEKRMQLIK